VVDGGGASLLCVVWFCTPLQAGSVVDGGGASLLCVVWFYAPLQAGSVVDGGRASLLCVVWFYAPLQVEVWLTVVGPVYCVSSGSVHRCRQKVWKDGRKDGVRQGTWWFAVAAKLCMYLT
jgi:hypothetical protein